MFFRALIALDVRKHYSADHEYDELIVNPSSSTPSREKRRAKMDVERFRRSRIRDSNALHQIESKYDFDLAINFRP